MISLEEKIKKANKDFYDIVALSYEAIDGRRLGGLYNYLAEELHKISRSTETDSILDLGCGSGFVSKVAGKYFKRRYALDISPKIIRTIDDPCVYKITADSDLIPIGDAQLDCVVTFAVLHHFALYQKIFPEIYRVLKADGIYYSDHDMDSLFFKRYRPLVAIYRKLTNAKRRYLSEFNQLSKEMYDCAEFNQNGIPSDNIKSILKSVGFKKIEFQYHWFGLSSFTDKIFGKKTYQRGYAPIVKIIAAK